MTAAVTTDLDATEIRTPFEVGDPVRYTGDFVQDASVLPTYVVAEVDGNGVVTMTLPDGTDSRDVYFGEIQAA